MQLTGSLMFVYICINVGDPVEGGVGMALTGSLVFVYRQTLDNLLMAYQHLHSTGSPS
jgi:hypothetical protein